MYYSDNSIKGVGAVQQTNYETKVVKRSSGEATTDKKTANIGPAVELSDSLKDYLKAIDSVQDTDITSETEQSTEIEESLKKNNKDFQKQMATESKAAADPVGFGSTQEQIDAINEAEQDTDASSTGTQNADDAEEGDAYRPTGPDGKPLSQEEVSIVQEMKQRDQEVRAHENAHVAAGSGLTSQPTYEYAVGPDGKRYAVGGHVTIDTSPGSTPEETIAKAQKIKAAATAPADPSPADRAVAAMATQMESKATMEKAQANQEELSSSTEKSEELTPESTTASTIVQGVGLQGDLQVDSAENPLDGNNNELATIQSNESQQNQQSFSGEVRIHPEHPIHHSAEVTTLPFKS